jgi:Spy/CpxP family protein refolding chaperone
MKAYKYLYQALMLLLPLIYFTGCNKHEEITNPRDLNFDSPLFAIVDYIDVDNAIDDATVDSDMSFNSSLFNYSFMASADFKPGNGPMLMTMHGGGNWMARFDWGKHLGLLLRRLNLTDAQKTSIKGFMQAYHDAMKPLAEQFKTANADIIKAANAKRKEIADKVKAGSLTRAAAKILIDALNKETRDKIEANPASKAIKTQMCGLRNTLLNNIKSVLVGDQITKWNDAISKMPDPCK